MAALCLGGGPLSVRGRKPKPTGLKLVEGNPGKRALPKDEPRARVEAPPKPRWLKGYASDHWDELVPDLLGLRVLTRIDGHALAALCVAYARWRDAEEALAKELVMEVGEGGYRQQRPEVSIATKALDQYKGLLVEFGMTPSARARVAAAGSDGEGDPAEGYF